MLTTSRVGHVRVCMRRVSVGLEVDCVDRRKRAALVIYRERLHRVQDKQSKPRSLLLLVAGTLTLIDGVVSFNDGRIPSRARNEREPSTV